MSATFPHAPQAHQQAGQRTLSTGLRTGLSLIGAIGVGLLMVVAVLALNSYQAFHATGEQIDRGVGISGGYTDTLAADSTYRLAEEDYVSGEVRTSRDITSTYYIFETYTNVVNFTGYTMPQEGGFISRMAIYIFQPGDTQVRLALYDDVGDTPHELLAETEPLSATSTGWLWFDIESQLIPGNTRYWLAYQATNDDARLGWKHATDAYRAREWSWGNFPQTAGVDGPSEYYKTCYQIQYTTTRYALDIAYMVPVTPTMDAYTLTIRAATSGEPFSVTADGQSVGMISYTPTVRHFFSDDMESGVGGWTANGFTHVITDSNHCSSPTQAWWTDDVPYASTASLTSVPITLPFTARDLELRFWHRVVSEENWDGGWLEYRIQNEDETWPAWSQMIWPMFFQGGYNIYLQDHIPSGSHWSWSGEITNTVRVRIPATAAGRSIQWRWVFECDDIGGEGPYQPDGWWIDDVQVLGTASDDTDLIFPVPLSLVTDGQVGVRFQDTITNSYPDRLGIDLIEITGLLYNRPPTVTVITPNGGEYLSGDQTIEWSGLDPNRDIVTYNVYLSTNGGVTWTTSLYETSYSETETPAIHSWNGLDTTAFGDSDNCLILVEASDGDAGTSDQSDAVFTIDNTAPSVTLTAPNGGEFLQGGGSYNVTWNASDANLGPSPIALYYSTDGGASFPSAITIATGNDGSHTWIIPAFDNADVRVRVVATDLAGNSSHDDSDASFAVDSTAPSVTLTAPNGSEVLRGGESYTITWGASDANFGAQPITLHYSTDGGLTFPNVIVATTENDGTYTWNVPALDNTNVRVRAAATDLAGNSSHDDSDASFAVDSTAPSVTLTAPNGSEVLRGGGSYTITWGASDANFGAQPITLHYSTDGGLTFPNVIVATTENDGTYMWNVPTLDNTNVRVRVVAIDLVGHSSQDDSDANFAMDSTDPIASLIAPNGGEVLAGGGNYEIAWSASDANFGPQPIALRYSTDGGATYPHVIVDATEDDGAHTWNVPALDSATVRVRVIATDRAGHSDSDDSYATFTIDSTPPTIANQTPIDGSTIVTGTPVISATLADTLSGIYSPTIAMAVDGSPVAHVYDPDSGTVSYVPSPALTNASHEVSLSVRDLAGNAASWQWDFSVNEPPASLLLTAYPTTIETDGLSTATITATVYSHSGHLVANGTQVVFSTTMGTLAGETVYTTTTQSGAATAVLTAPDTEGTAVITAKAGEAEGTIEVLISQVFRVYLPIVVSAH